MTGDRPVEDPCAEPHRPLPAGARIARGFFWFAAMSGLVRAVLLVAFFTAEWGSAPLALGTLLVGGLVDLAAILALPFPVLISLLLDLRPHVSEWARAWVAFEVALPGQVGLFGLVRQIAELGAG